MGAPHVLAKPPRVALIGSGFIGPVHAEALRRIGVVVAGLLDITPERARPLAERLGIAKVYNTLEELLADPSISAVHIASPNNVHFEHAKRRSRLANTYSARSPWRSVPRRLRSWSKPPRASQASRGRKLQPPLLSALSGDARSRHAWRVGPNSLGLGFLHPGLAAVGR